MRTRREKCYLGEEKVEQKKQSDLGGDRAVIGRKRPKFAESMACDLLDSLPDDLVLSILAKLSSSASSPSDFISVLLTCKRFNELGLHSSVLSKASPKVFAVKADKWSESVHQFLKSCADAGNADACYTLGMIRFYCLANHGSGASFLAKAAIKSHAPALYSLAVIQFNGSGCFKNDKDLRAGVSLCARAAFLGHIDALRELGHCFQDGYGVRRNVVEGRRYLVQANAREFLAIPSSPVARCPLLSEPVVHPVNRFLSKWFTNGCTVPGLGLRLCSHTGCGRSETRKHEFRRCSICGTVNYCSRACQALDWKVRHKTECAPLERVHLMNEEGRDGDENGGVGEGHDNYMLMQSHSNDV